MSQRRMPPVVAEAVVGRSGGNCEVMLPVIGCTMQGEHLHHRKISGREHAVENLLHVCHVCHEWIHKHPRKSYGLGLLVKMNYDPGATHVARRGRVVLLNGSGGYEIREELEP